MANYIIIGIIILLFWFLGIQLCRGKWLNILAGFNTMSEAEKETYDKKKLGRGAGIGMMIYGNVLQEIKKHRVKRY